MIRPTYLWRSVAALGAASLVLTGCGGGGGEPNAGGQPSKEPETKAPQSKEDGVLKLGTLLPQTGSLKFLGPPEFAGVQLAVDEINKAGGVLGKPVEKFDGDSGDTTTNIASQTTDRLLSQGVDVIIGAASSGVSFTVIDKITAAGVVMFSPANTSPDFTEYDDKGLYFRTAPSDVLQGRVAADNILADGNTTVAILALQDPYGEGLADNAEEGIVSGGGEVVAKEIYDPNAAEYAAEVSAVKAQDPDAILLIGFEESLKIVQELIDQGIGPQDKKLYLVDGNLSNELFVKLPKGTMTGTEGTLPGAATTKAFQGRLLKVDPDLTDFAYAAEAYDATILSALGAVAAKSDAGTAIASELVNVSTGGTKCTEFAECVKLLDQGEDIDYDGVSGPVEFSDKGDPTEASIGIYTYTADNTYDEKGEYQTGKL